ncbi:MAG TPA: hypothetical protein PLS46_00455 [Microthrixaceae bacterium]|nr:hypothetical protein [Microthrixaceae bacterium]
MSMHPHAHNRTLKVKWRDQLADTLGVESLRHAFEALFTSKRSRKKYRSAGLTEQLGEAGLQATLRNLDADVHKGLAALNESKRLEAEEARRLEAVMAAKARPKRSARPQTTGIPKPETSDSRHSS